MEEAPEEETDAEEAYIAPTDEQLPGEAYAAPTEEQLPGRQRAAPRSRCALPQHCCVLNGRPWQACSLSATRLQRLVVSLLTVLKPKGRHAFRPVANCWTC